MHALIVFVLVARTNCLLFVSSRSEMFFSLQKDVVAIPDYGSPQDSDASPAATADGNAYLHISTPSFQKLDAFLKTIMQHSVVAN